MDRDSIYPGVTPCVALDPKASTRTGSRLSADPEQEGSSQAKIRGEISWYLLHTFYPDPFSKTGCVLFFASPPGCERGPQRGTYMAHG